MIDLAPADLATVRRILDQHLPGSDFGSRATHGTTSRARRYSDLDLVIHTGARLDPVLLADLGEAFDDSDLEFRVDLVDAATLTLTPAFRRIVDLQSVPLPTTETA